LFIISSGEKANAASLEREMIKELQDLAFANSGPDTNSSQFFITMSPLTNLNKKHTIIGGTKTREDLGVLRTLRQDDKILNIDIKGRKIDKFLDYFPEEVSEWESKLVKPAKR